MSKALTTSSVLSSIDRSEKIPQRKDPVYKQFIQEIGGRAGLRQLALASENPKALELVALLDDETYKSYGVKKLLQAASMTFAQALQLRDDRNRNLAVSNMISKLPALADDLMEDARTTKRPCPVCDTKRVLSITNKEGVTEIILCHGCKGFGELIRPGDKDARQIVAKATKIIDNNPNVGVTVNVPTQINNNFGTSFEDTMRKAGKLIQATARRVDESSNS